MLFYEKCLRGSKKQQGSQSCVQTLRWLWLETPGSGLSGLENDWREKAML